MQHSVGDNDQAVTGNHQFERLEDRLVQSQQAFVDGMLELLGVRLDVAPVVAEFFKLKPQSDEQPLDLPTGCNVARDLHIISRDDEGGNLVSGYEVFNRSLVLSERVAQIRWRGRPGAQLQEHTVFRL